MSNRAEWQKCRQSIIYFAQEYAWILSSEQERWIRLDLWPFQIHLLKDLDRERRIILLKARQLGFTTMVLIYLLWRFVFYPVATMGLFSRGELEAMDLLERLVAMYGRLPQWMRADKILINNAHFFQVSTGSWARALSTRKGESFSFRYLFWDEIDRFENPEVLIKNTKPAADASNAQIIAGSISDKDKPDSVFKNMFRAAQLGDNNWFDVFLSWNVRPGRDRAWYEEIVKDSIERHGGDEAGAMDEVYQQYPSNPEEALSPRKQGKRVPYMHIQRVYEPMRPMIDHEGPAIPTLRVYVPPIPGQEYVMGADPAEGVEGGSDSAAVVLNKATGEEVATIKGKIEPKKEFPLYIFNLARWYNEAGILVERNNHGHAVLTELIELIAADRSGVEILLDPADLKEGWLTSPSGTGKTRGKAAMYDTGAQHVKDQLCIMHDKDSAYQLADIDIGKLKATGGNDDCADAFVLACVARILPGRTIKGNPFV